MRNPTNRYRVDFYTANDEYNRYELFNTEDEAIQFSDETNNMSIGIRTEYVGPHEIDFSCVDCKRPIDPEERYIELYGEEIFYCMDCVDEIQVIEYVTKKGTTLGTDNEITVEND